MFIDSSSEYRINSNVNPSKYRITELHQLQNIPPIIWVRATLGMYWKNYKGEIN